MPSTSSFSNKTKKRVALLGATGSIGKNTVDVLRMEKEALEPVLFTGHTDTEGLLALAREFPGAALALSGHREGPREIRYYGREGLLRAIADAGADIAVNGISGAAGLEPSLAVLNEGTDLALANKETIVMAGPLVHAVGAEKKARIIPVDSEHSAIFNLLKAHGEESLEEILLTASGGPFRTYSQAELAAVSPQDALRHPTWKMGAKITVDSASLANKGLEVIEAVRLFKVKPEQVRVVVHPQSIVHSLVRLRDGAVYGEFSLPDMRLPIQHALFYPERRPASFGRLEFDALTLEFEKPDYTRFPMLPLAYDAIRAGGLYPAIYNGANEIAVDAFLTNSARFLDIPRIVAYVLNKNWKQSGELSLDSVLDADRKAREIAQSYILEKKR